jgi:hypothetical protein
MKKLILVIFLLVISIIAGCGIEDVEHIGLKELGIDKSKGSLSNNIDTHGSLGDGCTYTEIEFKCENADTVEDELKSNKHWKQLPLSLILNAAVYGNENMNSLVTSFDEGIPAIPDISNGYYYFKDRHSESTDSTDDSELFNRSSFNFDILLYDMDTHILYIFQLDT